MTSARVSFYCLESSVYLGPLQTFSCPLVPVSEPRENKGAGLLRIAIPSIKLQLKSVSFSKSCTICSPTPNDHANLLVHCWQKLVPMRRLNKVLPKG